MRAILAATGSAIPSVCRPNSDFLQHDFRGTDGARIGKPNEQILEQFEAITGIRERRHVPDDRVTSDIAAEAAANALDSSGIDRETLDTIIVAHNFGDVRAGTRRSDRVPSLAARVKRKLGIRNPATAAWDLVFGCPGWLQGVIVAETMIRAGDARRVLGIIDEDSKRIWKKKLQNDPALMSATRRPSKKDILEIVVESTYNWYWLVDLMIEEGYRVHLTNPSKVQQCSGLKHGDDEDDPFCLAEMLRLKILPKGIFIRRNIGRYEIWGHLVRLRTSLIQNFQNILARNIGTKMHPNHMKALRTDHVTPLLAGNDDLSLAGRVSKEAIDSLTKQISAIEVVVEKRINIRRP